MSSRPLPVHAPRPRRARAALVIAGTALGAAACVVVAVLLGRQLVEAGTGSLGLPDVLVSAVELALALGAGAWLARTSTDVWSLSQEAARSDAGPGSPSHLMLPTGRARVAALLLGVSLGATALPAQAAPRSPAATVASTAGTTAAAPATPSDGSRARSTAGWTTSSSPGSRQGDRAGAPAGPVSPELRAPAPPQPSPVDPELRPARQAQTGRPAPAATHVVVRGDTLWRIAARHLPPDADAETVARACAAWHDRNRDTIGPDRDLILPGQVLTAPVAAPTVNQLQGNP
ncbi:LysM peptidoglycan-binding domain-containing protein [Arsenicicoccus sp. UBA7492]|uniref:LysM peptidoglycan-binding domain-containing protein n=1 Tax=Arsenicicoccus sp. UBA7492 TaxID=1946057 RepID=UPI00257AAAD9|nr:LysM peptidoglycan-binding domain-containing protein [Arsenicicoccus sp. UBA7492]